MQSLALVAIAAVAPFVPTLHPTPAQQPVAPTPAPAAANANPSPQKGVAKPAGTQLSNLVAEAIKRKLERAGQTGNGQVDLPPVGGDQAPTPQFTPGPIDRPVAAPPSTEFPSLPDRGMMPGEPRIMMGAPTDGSPAYVRTAGGPSAPGKPANAAGNPLAPATDPMEPGPAAAPAAAEPGVNHNLLDIFVGTWDVSANFDNGPDQPQETASGQMINTWQLEGRWLKQEYAGQMSTLGSFRGLGYIGYDNLARSYVSTWMDTLSTSCMMSKGSFDEKTATFTLSGDFSTGGEKYTQKQVITVVSPDRYTVTMYLAGPDGVEFKTGNLEYNRSVRAVTGVPTRP